MTETRLQRVQRGMLHLDARTPGWRGKIDLAQLDMGSARSGLLEQLYGRGTFFLCLSEAGLPQEQAYQHGFAVSPFGLASPREGEPRHDRANKRAWGRLTADWKRCLG